MKHLSFLLLSLLGLTTSIEFANLGNVPLDSQPDFCPHDIPCFTDLDAGIAHAKEADLPILLDFTGWGCVANRRMEELVWSDPEVLHVLKNKVVAISLYVDERTFLEVKDRYVSETTGRLVERVGQKWADFQLSNYEANYQPYYVMIGHEDYTPLHSSMSYEPDIEKYLSWLKEGIRAFNTSNE